MGSSRADVVGVQNSRRVVLEIVTLTLVAAGVQDTLVVRRCGTVTAVSLTILCLNTAVYRVT
jgi:hypothetical protein